MSRTTLRLALDQLLSIQDSNEFTAMKSAKVIDDIKAELARTKSDDKSESVTNQLRALAQEALADIGRWSIENDAVWGERSQYHIGHPLHYEIIPYIAAVSPEKVIALLDEIDALTAELEIAQKGMQKDGVIGAIYTFFQKPNCNI